MQAAALNVCQALATTNRFSTAPAAHASVRLVGSFAYISFTSPLRKSKRFLPDKRHQIMVLILIVFFWC